jgi:hypothetical protein
MPFDKLEKFRDHAHYKSVLKTELQKVGATPVKYHYFEKFKFDNRNKDGEPFVAVGAYPNTFVDDLKGAGVVYKARGRMTAADNQPVRFTVEHGALTEPKLNVALKEVSFKATLAESLDSNDGKDDLANEPMATGEVVGKTGGQGAGIADAVAKAKATHAKLRTLLQTWGQKLPDETRKEARAALGAADDAFAAGKLSLAERSISEARMHLDSFFASAKNTQQKALDSTFKDKTEAFEKATSAVATLPDRIAKHDEEVKRLGNIAKGLANTKDRYKTKDWPDRLAQANTDLEAAKVTAQKLAARLKDAENQLKDDPEVAARVREQVAELMKNLKDAEAEFKALSVDPDGRTPGALPGKTATTPGLKEAQQALEAQMAPFSATHVAHAKAVTDIEKLAKELRRRYDALDARLDEECETPLVEFEDEAARLVADPPTDDAFYKPLLAKAMPILAWVGARESLLKQVKARDVATAYKALLSKSPNDGTLMGAKERLDEMISGAGTPTADQIRKLLVMVAPKGDEELLERMKLRDSAIDEAVKWGNTGLSNGLLKEVWKASAKAARTNSPPETIKGKSLETVETAIAAWRTAAQDAPLGVSNMHVPGRGRPQYKAGKDVTRPDIQANFMSKWNGKVINAHVEVVECARGEFYKDGRVVEALINELVEEGRLNLS